MVLISSLSVARICLMYALSRERDLAKHGDHAVMFGVYMALFHLLMLCEVGIAGGDVPACIMEFSLFIRTIQMIMFVAYIIHTKFIFSVYGVIFE